MINSQDIKMGTCIRMDGKLFFVIDFLHVKPGKGNTFMRVKLKNVVDGRVLERRFDISEKLEDVRVERRPYQFLYKEGEDYIFMNQETYDQCDPLRTWNQGRHRYQHLEARHSGDRRRGSRASVRERGRPRAGRHS